MSSYSTVEGGAFYKIGKICHLIEQKSPNRAIKSRKK